MRMYGILLLALAATAALTGQINVAVMTTPTQAVLSYAAPSDLTPCQVKVSQSPQMNPLALDVDPKLFSGADQDFRPGSVVNGTSRFFVVGARRADTASDGKRYSRALEAAATYFYQITCDSLVGSGQFTTQNPPLGNNYSEAPPFDPRAFGNYGWPSIDWAYSSKTYVDPLTGVLLKRVTAPGWFGRRLQNLAFGYFLDTRNTWTDDANALSGSANKLATYSGSSSDPLFVAMDAATFF